MIEKKFYTLREIAEKISVPYHTLVYWQKEFDIKPRVSYERKFRRKLFFDEKSLKEFRWIKFLVKREGYSVPGARSKLAAIHRFQRGKEVKGRILVWIRGEIAEILELLNNSNYG